MLKKVTKKALRSFFPDKLNSENKNPKSIDDISIQTVVPAFIIK